jgi:flagellar hook-basal body complex protein FliE
MRIGPDPFVELISRTQPIKLSTDEKTDENSSKASFGEILKITMTGATDNSRALSAVSREENAKLLIGEEENLIDNLVAGQKSTLAFELNLAIRTKVIEAYNEVMRYQV